MRYVCTDQVRLRGWFWEDHPELHGVRKLGPRGRVLSQNDQPAEVRTAWVEWIDRIERDRLISPELASRATL